MCTPSANDPSVFDQLAAPLSDAGLDLLCAFDAARYNEAVASHPSLSPLDTFGREEALAFIVGNSLCLWSRFVDAYAARSELRSAEHPLDAYVSEVVTAVTSRVRAAHRVHFAHDPSEGRVSMLHAAEASGLAHVGPVHLAVHPEHGPWIGLRAVVVVDAPAPPPPRDARPSPCVGCAAPCRTTLEAALAATGETPRRQGDIAATWRRWVEVRDACPVGRASRYGEAQLRYHYTKDRSSLTPA